MNELDMALLKHLLHNKKVTSFLITVLNLVKPVVLIRTQSDKSITGIQEEDEEIGDVEALNQLKQSFGEYIENEVIQNLSVEELKVFYIGLPVRDFEDFAKIVDMIKDLSITTIQ